VKADFHSEIKRTGDIMLKYARVIKRLVEQEKLLDFHKSAIAYLLELAARYAGKKEKLTTRFSFLADIAREANYWAMDAKSKIVTSDHVRAAYQKAKDRHALAEEKMDEYINENTILIETAGERVGCINGLAVFGTDYYMFGKPVRISSSVALGNGTIINVERESGLSGKIHDKAIHIIGGYFRETFGRQFPLTFSANIVFEQSYGPIDGDSASAAEVFALLSALISVPLKQSLAITGSISQKGEIQPIGGVNEKIEGFYRTCKLKGFVKGQGVIIPEQNVQDLMLNDEVLESVRKKEFHIYPIKRVEEGLELMTGKKAGAIQADETFEKNTLYYCVEAKLKEMYHKAKNPFKEPKMKKARGSKTKETKA
jgi:ATP-dependent Lon protease